MPAVDNSICDALKEGIKTNKRLYEVAMGKAKESENKAIPYIMKNNEMVKQIQREIALLGANTLIRNRGIKLLAGISFLEELDVLSTPQEKSSQIQILMSRLMMAHKDAMAAITVVERHLRSAEFEKFNYEDKKKEFERMCRGS